MNSRIGNDNSSPGGILNSKSRLSVLPGHTSHGTGQVIAAQEFHVCHLEGLEVQIVQSQECDRVLNVKAEHKGGYEIGTLLECAGIECVGGCFDFDGSCFGIEANL